MSSRPDPRQPKKRSADCVSFWSNEYAARRAWCNIQHRIQSALGSEAFTGAALGTEVAPRGTHFQSLDVRQASPSISVRNMTELCIWPQNTLCSGSGHVGSPSNPTGLLTVTFPRPGIDGHHTALPIRHTDTCPSRARKIQQLKPDLTIRHYC